MYLINSDLNKDRKISFFNICTTYHPLLISIVVEPSFKISKSNSLGITLNGE